MRSAVLAVVAGLLAQSLPSPARVVPSRADLTIRTQTTFDQPSGSIQTTVLQFKGARERRESAFEHAGIREVGTTTIIQCDARRSIILDEAAKTFASMPIVDETENLNRVRREMARQAAGPPHPAPPGPVVTITTDSVDTGERRQHGRYVARHVVATERIERDGSHDPLSVIVVDGWYIDVGPQGCWNWGSGSRVALVGSGVESGGRVNYVQRGTAPLGLAIEEIDRRTSSTGTDTTRTALVEFSEVPIDARLFAVPGGYRAALPLLGGGYDFSRPDTLANRVGSYWNGFMDWAKALLR